MSKYRIFYWKHIPSAITVSGEGREVKLQLPQRFQVAIDTYAMNIGATSTTDYAREYKRGEWIEREGSPEQVAQAVLAELEKEFATIEIPRRAA